MTEKWREDDYCLIRAGVPPFVWNAAYCGYESREQAKETCSASDGIAGMNKVRYWNCIKLLRKVLPGYSPHKTILESHRESGEKKHELENCIREWQTALRLLADNPNQISCVYEDSLRRELGKEVNRKLWRTYWNVLEFEDYRDWKWVQKLMPHAVHDYYVIVGFAPYMSEILYSKARQMRGVRWILPEKQYNQNMQDFLDEFYEETGLVIETELISSESIHPWAGVYITSSHPVNVLDFSGEERISACGVPQGSVWIDMDSREEKCRRMEARNPGVLYFSLKKTWKQAKTPHFRAKSPSLP